jgi:predicted amidohydrolase
MSLAITAVQVAIAEGDLDGVDRLRVAIDRAADQAVAGAPPADHRLLVFPGGLGLLGVLAAIPPAATAAQALTRGAIRRPLAILRGALDARTLDPKHAALVALAPDAERAVCGAMARIARRHGAWVVGGAHLRVAESGDVMAASSVYDPDGRHVATIDKVNLVSGLEDRVPGGLGLTRGDPGRVKIVDTGFGPLAVLIGYDAFAAPRDAGERFTPLGPWLAERGGVAIAANPAANVWGCDAWRAGGLGRMLGSGTIARYGVTAHLVGRVMDLAFEGESEIVRVRGASVECVARAGQWDRGAAVTYVADDV